MHVLLSQLIVGILKSPTITICVCLYIDGSRIRSNRFSLLFPVPLLLLYTQPSNSFPLFMRLISMNRYSEKSDVVVSSFAFRCLRACIMIPLPVLFSTLILKVYYDLD